MESLHGLFSVPSHPPAAMLRVLLRHLVGSLCGVCGCASGVVWRRACDRAYVCVMLATRVLRFLPLSSDLVVLVLQFLQR